MSTGPPNSPHDHEVPPEDPQSHGTTVSGVDSERVPMCPISTKDLELGFRVDTIFMPRRLPTQKTFDDLVVL